MQARLFESRPGFWPVLAFVFLAGWLGGLPAAVLWALIGCYALFDVLRGSRPEPRRERF